MSPQTATRTNPQWVSDLRSDPPVAAALAELRDDLKRGLAKALSIIMIGSPPGVPRDGDGV